MGILETPRQAIWTPKNNTTPIFIPLTGPLDAMDWVTVHGCQVSHYPA